MAELGLSTVDAVTAGNISIFLRSVKGSSCFGQTDVCYMLALYLYLVEKTGMRTFRNVMTAQLSA